MARGPILTRTPEGRPPPLPRGVLFWQKTRLAYRRVDTSRRERSDERTAVEAAAA